jgi:type I restriction enzyme S subunit
MLINEYIPHTKVWAYGSRVKGNNREYSDLDLVAFTKDGQKKNVYELRDAFEESDIPFRIDFFEWDKIPENFKSVITQNYVELV